MMDWDEENYLKGLQIVAVAVDSNSKQWRKTL